jgi:FKBP-type peptidyl-prolyl cis-trans isomerase FkpA
MKKGIYLVALLLVGLAGCKKDEECPQESTASAPANERTVIRDYLQANSITATEHTSGVFIAIQDSGVGTKPGICNRVVVHYNGKFMQSNTTFDSGNSISFLLSEVIAGWQKGMQVLKPGGRMMLYVPPTMGYGASDYPSTANPVIPGGSYLKFDVQLVSVQ